MTVVRSRRDLVEEILKELGVLLKMRIDSHVDKYYEGVPARFLNQFIICPAEYVSKDDDCYVDWVGYPRSMLKAFNDQYVLEEIELRLEYLELNDRMELVYEFAWDIYSIKEVVDSDETVYFQLHNATICIDEANMEKIEGCEKKLLEEALGNIKLLQLSWHD